MFKVGDEVLVKGEVVEVMSAVPYPTKVRFGEGEDAFVFSNDEVCYADKIVKTYADGLNDAWELAKKIYDMTCKQIEKIFDVDGGFWNVIREITVEEAIAKIEAYEKKIKVNDIVKVKGESCIGIVTAVCPTGIIYVLWKDGGCGDYEPCELETTGRTAEGLEVLLRQIAE